MRRSAHFDTLDTSSHYWWSSCTISLRENGHSRAMIREKCEKRAKIAWGVSGCLPLGLSFLHVASAANDDSGTCSFNIYTNVLSTNILKRVWEFHYKLTRKVLEGGRVSVTHFGAFDSIPPAFSQQNNFTRNKGVHNTDFLWWKFDCSIPFWWQKVTQDECHETPANLRQDEDHHTFYRSAKGPFGIVTRKYYKCTEMIFSWNYIVRRSFLSNRRHWQPAGGNFHHDGSNVWCTVCLVLAEPWVPIMLSSTRRRSVAGRLSSDPPKWGERHLCKLFCASLTTASRSRA